MDACAALVMRACLNFSAPVDCASVRVSRQNAASVENVRKPAVWESFQLSDETAEEKIPETRSDNISGLNVCVCSPISSEFSCAASTAMLVSDKGRDDEAVILKT